MTGKGRKGRKLEEWERITLRNLERGMVVKNYPALCRLLNIDVRTGNSKYSQLEWLSKYVVFVQSGHKFLIKDVYYDKEIEPRRGPGGDNLDKTHIKYVESLLLHLILNSETDFLLLSRSAMLSALGLINDNYGYAMGNVSRTAKLLGVETIAIQDWRNSVSGSLVSAVDGALVSLENQSLIYWDKKITVFEDYIFVSEDGHRERVQGSRKATEEEVKKILAIERDTLEEMNCSNKGVVIAVDRWNEFRAKVINELVVSSNIKNYWDSYYLLYNIKHIQKEVQKRNIKNMNKEDLDEIKDALSSYMKERIMINSKRRKEKSMEDIENIDHGLFGKTEPKRLDSIRSSSAYLEMCQELNDLLLSSNAPNIVSDLRRISISKK